VKAEVERIGERRDDDGRRGRGSIGDGSNSVANWAAGAGSAAAGWEGGLAGRRLQAMEIESFLISSMARSQQGTCDSATIRREERERRGAEESVA
jgi:hypothetical protein